jgi:antitoxin component YwqK of YwqJK toxin-antitoxin module
MMDLQKSLEETKYYYPNGKLYYQNIFRREIWDGVPRIVTEHKLWYDTGQIHKHSFRDTDAGHPIREHKTWYSNGQLDTHRHYNDKGQLHGKYRGYYPNGDPLIVSDHVNGKTRGRVRWWYGSGQDAMYLSWVCYNSKREGICLGNIGLEYYINDEKRCQPTIRNIMSLLYFKAILRKRIKRIIRQTYLDNCILPDLGNIIVEYYG